jgi:hypothetical protein
MKDVLEVWEMGGMGEVGKMEKVGGKLMVAPRWPRKWYTWMMFCGKKTHLEVDISKAFTKLSSGVSDDTYTRDVFLRTRPTFTLDQFLKQHPNILLLGGIVEPTNEQTLLGIGITRQPSITLR